MFYSPWCYVCCDVSWALIIGCGVSWVLTPGVLYFLSSFNNT